MIRGPCLDMMGSNCAKIVLRDRTGRQCDIACSATPTFVKPAMTTILVASVLAERNAHVWILEPPRCYSASDDEMR